MEFKEYYKSFGFTEYPFSTFTSEAETDKFNLIYLKPSNHSVIIEGLKNTSAIVIGERGTGKTALSFNAATELSKNGNLLVRIEEFSALKESYETDDLYRFLIERIATEFFLRLTDTPSKLWNYTKDDRIDLSMYLSEYLGASSKNQLRDKIQKIQNSLVKRSAINSYNFLRVALNYGLKAATKVFSDAITKHFSGLPEFDSGDSEYFKRIESEVDQTFTTGQKQYFYLEKLCKLIKKSKIPKIYILIDKVDEDSRFENDADLISAYIKKIASDNKILTNDLFHVLLFSWSTPFNYIKESVRTQKLAFQSLEWDSQELKNVAQKRFSAYSEGKVKFNEIFEEYSEEDMTLILGMCNRNPRDLWHILHKCFEEQHTLGSVNKISKIAIDQAIQKFVIGFNYYEYYPKKLNARANTMDVYSYIKHLLKLDSTVFTKDKLNKMAGTGTSTNNYVVAMENMGLIKKTAGKAQAGAMLYEIRDPKVCYAMSNKIAIGN